MRRTLFFLVFLLIIVGAFILGMNVGARFVATPLRPIPNIYTVSLDSKLGLPGLGTGINLTSGDRLTIMASGSATYHNDGSSPFTNPDAVTAGNGCPCPPLRGSSVIPSEPVGELLGSINQVGAKTSASWFRVGSSYSSVVSGEGQLYLIYNDWYYADNNGSYQATIVVERG
jgi:hypothetical protein